MNVAGGSEVLQPSVLFSYFYLRVKDEPSEHDFDLDLAMIVIDYLEADNHRRRALPSPSSVLKNLILPLARLIHKISHRLINSENIVPCRPASVSVPLSSVVP